MEPKLSSWLDDNVRGARGDRDGLSTLALGSVWVCFKSNSLGCIGLSDDSGYVSTSSSVSTVSTSGVEVGVDELAVK